MMQFLFKPGRINQLDLKNRIVMAPMGARGLVEPDGRFARRAIDYYTARAKGGVGLIITGLMAVDIQIEKRTPDPWSPLARTDSPLYIARLNELTEAVHDYGTRIAAQLTAGYGRIARAEVVRCGWAVAPSSQPCFADPSIMARELSEGEIEKLIQAFAFAASTVSASGFDAIELHGHEGYLMDQFMTGLWNKRQDKYGGDLEGRLRFPLEIIKLIRQTVGADFPLIFRMAGSHFIEGGRNIEQSIIIAKRLEEAGVDCLHIDAGCPESKHWAHPPIYMDRGCTVECASAIKDAVKIPVIAVGRLGYPDLAEKVLAENKADFIALGRPLLADPEWPAKVRSGRIEEIRPCIGDYDGCLGRIVKGKYISCSVNPQTGMEREFSLKPVLNKKSILVIGGGPGGMEAARVAAIRGHAVTLWEKNGQLGGNLIPAAVPEFKSDIKRLIEYLSHQMDKSGVHVELNKNATPELVIREAADEVIIATGAIPVIPNIFNVGHEHISTAIDLLLAKRETGSSVAVIGGGTIGCETALWLARKGKKVVLIEALQEIMFDAFSAIKSVMTQMLTETSITVMTGTQVLEVIDGGLIIENLKGRQNIETDSITLAVGFKSNTQLTDVLKKTRLSVNAIGDCVASRNVKNAIWEAFRLAIRI
jgi:2-enoate reductase